MGSEEIDKNHYKNIAIEDLQSRINIVKQITFTNEDIEKIIKDFFEEFKESKLAKFESIEEIKEALKRLEERRKSKEDYER